MVLFWEVTGSDKRRKLVVSSNKDGKGSLTLTIYPPLTPRNLPVMTMPYRVENWTFDSETQPSKAWVLRSGLRHVVSSNALPTLGRQIRNGEASWNQYPSFGGEFSFIKGYWEWTEAVLGMHQDLLEDGAIYDAIYASLFTYDRSTHIMQAFCEAWCPSTNTLLTLAGELSISLWDMHVLGGLPISGGIYDEYIPSASELTGTDVDSKSTPRSCKYLFEAYLRLYKRGGDRSNSRSPYAVEWIEFWSRRPNTYDEPPPRKEEKKKARSRSTYNPTGGIPKPQDWTKTTQAPFAELGIPSKYEKETHLAAYISCWLCVFVFPVGEARLIRPQTFKMASIMATGTKLNLGIPALANIYNGLNTISRSATPGQAESYFPIHYVYGWLSFYFNTHFANDCGSASPMMVTYSGEGGARYYGAVEARRKIFKADDAQWVCTTRRVTKDVSFFDDGKANPVDQDYFMCLRSNYLVLRWADFCIAEHYTPHRFSRQFGYYQDGSPGVLGQEGGERTTTLQEGFRLWRQSTFTGSRSRVTFPVTRVMATVKKYVSQDYKEWWSQVHGDYLENRLKELTVDPPVGAQPEAGTTKKSKHPNPEAGPSSRRRVKSVIQKRKAVVASSDSSDEEGHNSDRHWKRPRNKHPSSPARDTEKAPVNREAESSNKETTEDTVEESEHSNIASGSSSPKPTSPHKEPDEDQHERPEVSVFDGVGLVQRALKACVMDVWSKLRQKLEETPVEHLSSLQESVAETFVNLRKFDVDISSLEARVKEIFQKARDYDNLRSAISEKTSMESQGISLSLAQDTLEKAKEEVVRAKKHWLGQHKTLKDLKEEAGRLEQTLKSIYAKMKDCDIPIAEATTDLESAEAAVSAANAEVTRIRKLTVLTPEDEKNLSDAKKHLEVCRDDVLNFRLFID